MDYLTFLDRLDRRTIQSKLKESLAVNRLIVVTVHGEYAIRDRYDVRVDLLKEIDYLQYRIEQRYITTVYLNKSDKIVRCETSCKTSYEIPDSQEICTQQMTDLIEQCVMSTFL